LIKRELNNKPAEGLLKGIEDGKVLEKE